jgi:hypothetical protein
MDIDELAARLSALENEGAENKRNKRIEDFLGAHGSKFGGDREIGTTFLDELDRRGVDASDDAVSELLEQLREEVQALNEKVGAITPALEASAAIGGGGMADAAAAMPNPAGMPGAPGEGVLQDAIADASALGSAPPPPAEEPEVPPMDDAGAPPPETTPTPAGEVPDVPPVKEQVSDEQVKELAVDQGVTGEDADLAELAEYLMDLDSRPPETLSRSDRLLLKMWDRKGRPTPNSGRGEVDVTDFDPSKYSPEDSAELDRIWDLVQAKDPEILSQIGEEDMPWMNKWGEHKAQRDAAGVAEDGVSSDEIPDEDDLDEDEIINAILQQR